MSRSFPTIGISTDTVVGRSNHREIRRLAGPVFLNGRYLRTKVWFTVEGVLGQFPDLEAAAAAAMKRAS